MIFIEDKKMAPDPFKIIEDSKKSMYHISGIAYSDVQKLQEALDKKGIKNNVDAGGLFIYPKGHYEVISMNEVCKSFKDDFKAVPIPGVSRHMSDVILSVGTIKKTPFPRIQKCKNIKT